MALAALRADRRGGRVAGARCRGRQVERDRASRDAAGVRGAAAGRREDRVRGAGGVRQPLRHLPADRRRALRLRCHGHRRSRQSPPRHPDSDHRTARRGRGGRRGSDSPRAASQWGVRRCGARRAACVGQGAGHAARRARGRGRGGVAAGGVGRGDVHGGGVPRVGGRVRRGSAHRRRESRGAALERAGDHRRRAGRAERRSRGLGGRAVRAGQAQPSFSSATGSPRGAGAACRSPQLPYALWCFARRHPGGTGPGYEAATGGPAYRAALAALEEAWGAEPSYVATGGSIPLVNGLARAAPDAEVLLFGAQDSMCNLHAPNERVLFSELRNTVVAICAFVERYAADFRGRSQGGAAEDV